MADVDEVPAGREMDTLVAIKVMGLPHQLLRNSIEWYDGVLVCGQQWGDVEDDPGTVVPFYSTDIAAAWEVVKKMRADKWRFTLFDHLEGCVVVQFYRGTEMVDRSGKDEDALAICRAALEAVQNIEEN